jgi:HEXXH motif-containing protein
MLIGRYRVPAATFDMLAHGYADATVAGLLRGARLSKQILQIRAVVDAARPFRRAYSAVPVDEAFQLIDEAQQASAAAASGVLGYPLVGAWAAHCLRRLRRRAEPDTPLWVDLAQLTAIAAAAGIRAAVPVRLPVPIRAGTVSLPTLGSARLGGDIDWGVAMVTGEPGGYLIEGRHATVAVPKDPGQASPGWEPVDRLELTERHQTLTAFLDGVDPFRTHGLATAVRLENRGRAAWRSRLADAWRILVRHHPDRIAEFASGPIVVVPLAKASGAPQISGTNRDSSGAMALSLSANPFDLMLSMVHEFQHSKLGALLDLIDLYNVEDKRRHYSPWRADPRPIGGLLQGAYAFLAAARCWGRHAGRATGVVPASLAEYEFARVREQVAGTTRTLVASGALTAAGERFVAGLREAADALASRPVGAAAARLARVACEDHRLTWRLRNLRTDPATIESLVDAWRRAAPRPADRPPSRVAPEPPARFATQPRHELIRQRLDGPSAVTDYTPDSALAAGDYPAAASGYLAGLRTEPERLDLWAGLAVARLHTGPRPIARVYATEPELLVAMYTRLLAEGVAVDPDTLAGWLAG